MAEKAATILQEAIMNVRTLQSCNGQETMLKKYTKILKEGRTNRKMQYFYRGFGEGIFILIFFIFYLFGYK